MPQRDLQEVEHPPCKIKVAIARSRTIVVVAI